MNEQEYLEKYGMTRAEALKKAKEDLKAAARERDKNKVHELYQRLRSIFLADDVFHANEVSANGTVTFILVLMCLILTAVLVLFKVGYFEMTNTHFPVMAGSCVVLMLIGIVVNCIFHGEPGWIKHVLMLIVCVTITAVDALLGYRCVIVNALPVILSTRYMSGKFTIKIALLSAIGMLLATLVAVHTQVALDLNIIAVTPGTSITVDTTLRDAVGTLGITAQEYTHRLFMRAFLPNLFQFAVVATVCCSVSLWGHRIVKDQADITDEFTRIDTELSLARNIQLATLPNKFPAFPDRKEFDIYAAMYPAKEVGGDFYDFFMVDDDHLAMIIADVSGKGIPAALFMMVSKALLNTCAMQGKSTAEVLTEVNEQLCSNNSVEMFVTVWIGILQISSGKLTCSNAGHEYPSLRRIGNDFELVRDKHSLVLGGMENVRYRQYELQMYPGDSIFLYTDGVAEATNAEEELFGLDRMLVSLNKDPNAQPKDLLITMKKDIDDFVKEAPQFDDITMLAIKYMGAEKQ